MIIPSFPVPFFLQNNTIWPQHNLYLHILHHLMHSFVHYDSNIVNIKFSTWQLRRHICDRRRSQAAGFVMLSIFCQQQHTYHLPVCHTNSRALRHSQNILILQHWNSIYLHTEEILSYKWVHVLSNMFWYKMLVRATWRFVNTQCIMHMHGENVMLSPQFVREFRNILILRA